LPKNPDQQAKLIDRRIRQQAEGVVAMAEYLKTEEETRLRTKRLREERLARQASHVPDKQEINMAGGTKPGVGTKRAERFKDGLKKAGGIKTQKHAGPGRKSKTRPSGVKGAQLQKRAQP
jgi:hypothetical protein